MKQIFRGSPDIVLPRPGKRLAGGVVGLYCLLGTLFFLGTGGSGYVFGTTDPIFLALAYLIFGSIISYALGGARGLNVRAYVLTFCCCVFVTGACHLYSNHIFGVPQSFPDAKLYYAFLDKMSLREGIFALSRRVNSPLGVYIWKCVYLVNDFFLLHHGEWSGLLFNCMIIAFSAAVTARAAFEIVGLDTRKLRAVGTWSALNGLNWLCAAIFIRDGFQVLVNALSLWVFIVLLKGSRREIMCFVALAFLAFCSYGFRPSTLPLFLFLCGVCLLCWFMGGKMNVLRMLFLMFLPIVAVLFISLIQGYVASASSEFTSTIEQYEGIGVESSKSDSIGMRLIVNQPAPIRLVLATPTLLFLPTPLWTHFTTPARWSLGIATISEYHLIKTYIGLFMLFFMPFVLAAVIRCIDLVLRGKDQNIIGLFLLTYVSVGIAAVAMSSLDNRHLAQFMPAMLLLSLVPRRDDSVMRVIRPLSFAIWWGGMLTVHLLWAAMRFL